MNNQIKINETIDELKNEKNILEDLHWKIFMSESTSENIRAYQREPTEDKKDVNKLIKVLKNIVVGCNNKNIEILHTSIQINKLRNPSYQESDYLWDIYDDLIVEPITGIFKIK